MEDKYIEKYEAMLSDEDTSFKEVIENIYTDGFEDGISNAIPREVLEAMTSLAEYTLENEEKHYEESDEEDKKMHIFNDAKKLMKWLEKFISL